MKKTGKLFPVLQEVNIVLCNKPLHDMCELRSRIRFDCGFNRIRRKHAFDILQARPFILLRCFVKLVGKAFIRLPKFDYVPTACIIQRNFEICRPHLQRISIRFIATEMQTLCLVKQFFTSLGIHERNKHCNLSCIFQI